ncbi:MAG: GNAT family N-acetyltransferase [Clostridia bacterium]|nr:GNAT family N-acetyltransferase [Clostridia bacterium]
MNITEIKINKKKYLDLLLIADEQESMIDLYLERGNMFVLNDNGVKGCIVITIEGDGIIEIKNLAIYPDSQKKGYGKRLIEFVCNKYKGIYKEVIVGTGDSPLTVPFYKKCGFKKYRVEKDFFTKNYDHPIFECGIQLVDMVYLKRSVL